MNESEGRKRKRKETGRRNTWAREERKRKAKMGGGGRKREINSGRGGRRGGRDGKEGQVSPTIWHILFCTRYLVVYNT